ncbi:hypothetical protein Efla_005159 [Eimeria flavescens]
MNPIGLKVGPAADPREVVAICRRLNPHNQAGKLSLITRLGAEKVEAKLPSIVEAVQAANILVLWVCDPMHGNTLLNSQGRKERHLRDIISEVETTTRILFQKGERLGGLHLELTSENVVECIGGPPPAGGAAPLSAPFCDPLLNYQQAVEVVFAFIESVSVSSFQNNKEEINPTTATVKKEAGKEEAPEGPPACIQDVVFQHQPRQRGSLEIVRSAKFRETDHRMHSHPIDEEDERRQRTDGEFAAEERRLLRIDSANKQTMK